MYKVSATAYELSISILLSYRSCICRCTRHCAMQQGLAWDTPNVSLVRLRSLVDDKSTIYMRQGWWEDNVNVVIYTLAYMYMHM